MTAQVLSLPAAALAVTIGDVIAQMDVDVPGTLWERIANPVKRVTVWRIVSRDEDVNEEYTGELVRETDQVFELIVDGDMIPTTFPRQNSRGITVWRKS